jgi:hypothetical protein
MIRIGNYPLQLTGRKIHREHEDPLWICAFRIYLIMSESESEWLRLICAYSQSHYEEWYKLTKNDISNYARKYVLARSVSRPIDGSYSILIWYAIFLLTHNTCYNACLFWDSQKSRELSSSCVVMDFVRLISSVLWVLSFTHDWNKFSQFFMNYNSL